jgi:hypothetical protein
MARAPSMHRPDEPDTREVTRTAARPIRLIPAALGIAALLIALVVLAIAWTAPTRGAVQCYTRLITAANRGDLATARALCTDRFLRAIPLRPAEEGGVVGLPRGIHKNFRAWRQGPRVWLCPTNRVGPVYQFVRDPRDGTWKFDGPVGVLRPGGVFVPTTLDAEPDAPS